MSSTTGRRAPGSAPGEHSHNPDNQRPGKRQPAPDTRVLLSVEEAAERLDIGRSTFYELIRRRQIQTIHVGRLRKVPIESLREFVDAQRGAAFADDDSRS